MYYMQLAFVSRARADTHALECVPTCGLLLIGQRFVVVNTGRPHAGDARAPRSRTPQADNFGHITPLHRVDNGLSGVAASPKRFK